MKEKNKWRVDKNTRKKSKLYFIQCIQKLSEFSLFDSIVSNDISEKITLNLNDDYSIKMAASIFELLPSELIQST